MSTSPQLTKRQFSRIVLDALEPVLEANRKYLRFDNQTDAMLKIIETETGSSNYFLIRNEFDHAGEGRKVEYECKPSNRNTNSGGVSKSTVAKFKAALEVWCEQIRKLQEPSVLDDSILWGYEQEFIKEFELADDDADSAPFGYAQQLFIDRYLEVAMDGLESMRTDVNASLIDELKTEAQSVQSSITSETKNGVMRRLAKFWAKARKGGLKYSGWVVRKFLEGIVKEAAGKTFNWAVQNAHRLPMLSDNFPDQIA